MTLYTIILDRNWNPKTPPMAYLKTVKILALKRLNIRIEEGTFLPCRIYPLLWSFSLDNQVVAIERCKRIPFLRRCKDMGNISNISPEKCRQICNEKSTCTYSQWNPPYQVYKDDPGSVCFFYNTHSVVCDWQGGEKAVNNPGAQLFKCGI